MSDKKNTLNSVFGLHENPLVPKLKDAAILTGWIVGLILVAGLCWFLTRSLRSDFLLTSVNRALEKSGDSRRLHSLVSPVAPKGSLGFWYTILPDTIPRENRGNASAGNMAYIFTFIAEGTFFPCIAVFDPGGKVEEFIPLTRGGERMMKRLSPGILEIYTRRIEGLRS